MNLTHNSHESVCVCVCGWVGACVSVCACECACVYMGVCAYRCACVCVCFVAVILLSSLQQCVSWQDVGTSGTEKETERHSLILYIGKQVLRNTLHVERVAFRKKDDKEMHRCVLACSRRFSLSFSLFLTTGLRPPAAEPMSDTSIYTLAECL